MTRTGAVPLVDLAWQHRQLEAELIPVLLSAMDDGAFIGGAAVRAFETEFAYYCGRRHCVGVGNGTDALELMLRALDLPPGAGVVVPANTFFATAEAVVRAGGTPVVVDCDRYGLIDVEQAGDAVRAGAWGALPVHLYGQTADMEALRDAVGDPTVLVEDAAQAQGATRHGLSIGSWSLGAATSFYPGKNLGAYGDAGAVVTDDDRLAERVRILANHGTASKYEHIAVGTNSRLDALQALVLSAKLRHLDEWNQLRRDAARRYDALLAPLLDEGTVRLPVVAPGNVSVWHLYTVRVPRRDGVLRCLNGDGVGAGIHYPIPVHLQPGLAGLGYRRGQFPEAEAAAAELLSLPLYPGITADQQGAVVEGLRRALVATS